MDIQRTVLWVVFSMSLLFLWDNWMRYNGNPSMFFPSANQQAKPGAGAGAAPGAAKSDVPQASAAGGASAVAASAAAAGAVAPMATATPIKSETITITTDILKADIDTVGGELKRLELLKHKDTVDPTKNMVLFESGANHTYIGQSGLIGGAFPNHKSGFTAKPGARTLDAAGQVQLVLESEEGGVKLTKTYTFKKGDYNIDVKHEVTNASGAPIAPSLYLQLRSEERRVGKECRL